jgi:long-chain acyl-CoA synthetase
MSAPLLDRWNHTVRYRGRAVAIIHARDGNHVTFRELDALAHQIESRLAAELGDLRRRIVVFALSNGAEWIATLVALRRLGAVAVPIEETTFAEHGQTVANAIRATAWLRHDQLQRLGPGRRVSSAELCLFKLTSGSTGQPRPLAFTDAQMLADGRQVTRTMGIGPSDVNFALIPFGHSYGLGNLVFPLIDRGIAAVCGSSPLPHAIAAEVARHRPTVFPTVPAVLRALAESEIPTRALRSLRTVISAGSFLAPEVAQAFRNRFKRTPHNFYGASETGGIAYDRRGDVTLSGRAVGRPLRGVRLSITKTQRIEVTSAAVSARADRTVLLADRGEINARGELVLIGRAGQFVKLGGRRIGFAEVERALRQISGVAQAFVTALEGRAEPVLAAAVVSELEPTVIRTRLGHMLPAWKVPRRILRVAEFPLTPRGKPDMAALRAALAREDQSRPATTSP